MRRFFTAMAILLASASSLHATQIPSDIDVLANGSRLCTTTAPLTVRAAAAPDGRVLQTYQAGAIMAYIGEKRGTGVAYVNPCRACDSGYVAKAELFAKSDCKQ